MANIKHVTDYEYSKASDTLKYILDKEDNRFINVCTQKMQKAFGLAAAELVKRQMIVAIHEVLQANPNADRKIIVRTLVGPASQLADLTPTKDPDSADRPSAFIEAARKALCLQSASAAPQPVVV